MCFYGGKKWLPLKSDIKKLASTTGKEKGGVFFR
jgi:hypothetical protein